MESLTATLVVDGSSDRTLEPIVQFLLDEWCPIPSRILFAEGLHDGPITSRLPKVLQLYPCDLLFIHRDAELVPVATRQQEIEFATQNLTNAPVHICLIPVRMTESWLLLDEQAIRIAAGNPNGKTDLQLPKAKSIENLLDSKDTLHKALTTASELSSRRKLKVRPHAVQHRVAELMNVSNLRKLASFSHAEKQVRDYFATYQNA